jgi:hypothetical protein
VRLEAARPLPKRGWRGDALLLVLSTTAFTFVLVMTLGLLHGWAEGSPSRRVITVAFIAGVQLLACWAAIAPSARNAQRATLWLLPITMVALVALRETGAPLRTPPWACSAGHVLLGLGPLVIVLLLLRKAAITTNRALAAGAAVGSIGAISGEFGCGLGPLHVAEYHLPAWIFTIALTWWMSRQVRPASFAP